MSLLRPAARVAPVCAMAYMARRLPGMARPLSAGLHKARAKTMDTSSTPAVTQRYALNCCVMRSAARFTSAAAWSMLALTCCHISSEALFIL